MFELREQDTFSWPAKAKVPVNGQYQTVPFDVTFKVLSQPEISALIGEDDPGASLRVLREALISFSGFPVKDINGEEVEDLEERKDIILSKPFFVNAISEAWASGISGRRIKN
jgi:hypothetical protein